MRWVLILGLLGCFLAGCTEPRKHHERHYQAELCDALGGVTEYVLPDRSRVDCLTETYAVEVDFAKKWAEGAGQSLFYAEMTGKRAAVGLIVDPGKDRRYLERLRLLADRYDIKIFEITK